MEQAQAFRERFFIPRVQRLYLRMHKRGSSTEDSEKSYVVFGSCTCLYLVNNNVCFFFSPQC